MPCVLLCPPVQCLYFLFFSSSDSPTSTLVHLQPQHISSSSDLPTTPTPDPSTPIKTKNNNSTCVSSPSQLSWASPSLRQPTTRPTAHAAAAISPSPPQSVRKTSSPKTASVSPSCVPPVPLPSGLPLLLLLQLPPRPLPLSARKRHLPLLDLLAVAATRRRMPSSVPCVPKARITRAFVLW